MKLAFTVLIAAFIVCPAHADRITDLLQHNQGAYLGFSVRVRVLADFGETRVVVTSDSISFERATLSGIQTIHLEDLSENSFDPLDEKQIKTLLQKLNLENLLSAQLSLAGIAAKVDVSTDGSPMSQPTVLFINPETETERLEPSVVFVPPSTSLDDGLDIFILGRATGNLDALFESMAGVIEKQLHLHSDQSVAPRIPRLKDLQHGNGGCGEVLEMGV